MPISPATSLTRKRFLSLGAVAAATSPLVSRRSEAAARPDKKRPWIPPKEFLADLPRIMRVASLPGLAMAAVENGEVVWTQNLGVMNVKTKAPVREDTLFEAASMSKPAFAYVVMRLADDKLIDIDRPLAQRYKPDYLPKHPDIDLITARDVMRHSTGLPNWRFRPEDSMVPAFKPGSRWGYSGEGFFWLQLVVEHITGKGLDTVMRSRLFDPNQMPLSTYAWDAESARRSVDGHNEEGELGELQFSRESGNRFLAVADKWGKPISSWRYEDVLKALSEAPPHTHPVLAKADAKVLALPVNLFPNAAATLRTTASEYAKFMTLMMERKERASWEITEESRKAMLSRQITYKPDALYWGLGWQIEPTPSGELFSHGGNNGGKFKTFGLGDPIHRRALVVFTNGGSGDRVYQRVVRAATGHDMLEFLL